MELAQLLQPDRGQDATPLELVDAAAFPAWLAAQPPGHRALVGANRFKGAADTVLLLPGDQGAVRAVAGVAALGRLGPWSLARAAGNLPPAAYRLMNSSAGVAALGWLLAQHRFTRYKPSEAEGARVLLTSEPATVDAIVREAVAVALVRDLVDTPAADMGPAELEAEAQRLARDCGGTLTVTSGDALAQGFPMIHAVGQAAARGRGPRLIELSWGDERHPRLAIVGKGVCFDTGGLDIKPSSGMRLMKKDMGGAAHALALAQLITGARLPVRLHLLIPAVENAIAGDAMRPGDVLCSRHGLTVELANTDAEGRLVLADALTRAAEAEPALILDFATLTGAARVALGPDLPATFVNDDRTAEDVLAAATAASDALWRMPLHAPYADLLKSDIADLNNAPEGGMAGAVTAALFLQRFVPANIPWVHLDTFAWMPSAKPGRPKGGEALGLRALWQYVQNWSAEKRLTSATS